MAVGSGPEVTGEKGGGGLGDAGVEVDAGRFARTGSSDGVAFGTTGSGSAGRRSRDDDASSPSVAAAPVIAVQRVGDAADAGDPSSSTAEEYLREGGSDGGGGARTEGADPPRNHEEEHGKPDRFEVVEPISARPGSVATAEDHDPVRRSGGKQRNDGAEVSSAAVVGSGSDRSLQLPAESVGGSSDSPVFRGGGAQGGGGTSTSVGSKEGGDSRTGPILCDSTDVANHGAAAESANTTEESAKGGNPLGAQVSHMRCLVSY